MAQMKSTLLEVFGESPFMKTLDFFLMYPKFDYTKTQVARETGVSRITMESIWRKLVSGDIIVKTRSMGRSEMYQLNAENPKVKAIMRFEFELSSALMEQERLGVRAKSR